MSLTAMLGAPVNTPQGPQPDLVSPPASLLARLLESRLAHEQSAPAYAPLPTGVTADLRPALPKIATAAVMLYARRSHVDSFPLLFSTLALAHPN
ncbi:MAG: hypothetical protein HY910_15620 [Desulfarculus sp.]|nr:hypothetical protein [Desulfarculus sp.]